MLILISPAKKLDFDTPAASRPHTQPRHLDKSEILVNKLRKMSRNKLGGLMHLSPALAELNYNRYQAWQLPATPENSLQAVYAFRGDVYTGLDADTLSEGDLHWAQDHLRILSGLYGVLRPLDLIQPHRLEMGTSLPVQRKKNLYGFWQQDIAGTLAQDLAGDGSGTIINLASNEYFKSVDTSRLGARIINFDFKEMRDGKLRSIMLFVKQARGAMARYIIDNRLESPEAIKGFDREGYVFREDLSSGDSWTFVR